MTGLLEVRGLTKSFAGRTSAGAAYAVRDVDLEIADGEVLALTGESGSGKSTIARLILRLTDPDSGTIRLAGDDWLALHGEALRARRRAVQAVFQDPLSSLDPRLRAVESVVEPLLAHRVARRRPALERAAAALREVGLDDALGGRFPHELSGGERQRVALARALVCDPRLVIADEPFTALDPETRVQVVDLLRDARRARGLALLLISHDLPSIAALADRVAVLLQGRIVEVAPRAELLSAPRHPYTAALVAAATPARSGPDGVLPGPRAATPEAIAETGCAYRGRCPAARERCRSERPALRQQGPSAHVACHFPIAGSDRGRGASQIWNFSSEGT